MNVEIRDERFRAVIGDGGPTVETLGTGFDFTEGPVWQPGGEAPDLQRHAGQPHAPMDPRWRHRTPFANPATWPTATPMTARGGW